jgi:hypothetical protein
VQQCAIAILRHSTLVTALDTSAGNARPTRAFYIVRVRHSHDSACFRRPMHTPRTCRPAPRSPTPSHHIHARTDTHDATSPTQHNGMSASRRVSPNTAHTNKPRTPYRTLTQSIQTHKPRTPARRPAQHQPLCTAQSSLHAHRRAHVTHSTTHNSDHPTHRPQKIAPSHTRGLRATLTAEMSGYPASTGCCRRGRSCRSSPTACRTHEQPSRHTMAPDADTNPSQPPTTHLSASHSINPIKSNDKPVSTLHAIAHAQHRVRVTPSTTQPDSPSGT